MMSSPGSQGFQAVSCIDDTKGSMRSNREVVDSPLISTKNLRAPNVNEHDQTYVSFSMQNQLASGAPLSTSIGSLGGMFVQTS
jgi:hypothetical protein